jgi:outer membrane protein insertion porin family
MMKFFVFIFCFTFGLYTPSFAQDRGGDFFDFKPQSAKQTRVNNISVEGTNRVAPSTVISYMDIKPGESYSQDDLSESLKNLYSTGLFADVNIRQDKNDLVVVVVENPIINRVVFEGNDEIEDSDLAGEISSRPRAVYVRNDVRNDVSRVQELYRRSGKYSAEVTPEIIKLDQNRIDLIFNITEGADSRIMGVQFIGNEAFSDNDLRSAIATKENRWYRFLSGNDKYDPDRLAFDEELLRRFYLKNGYVDYNLVSTNSELAPNKDAFFITFTVDEGERYKINSITADTSALRNVNQSDVEAVVTMEEGDWYSSDDLENSVDAVTNKLGDLQYAFARIRPDVRRNTNQTVDVVFRAEETQRVFVEEINIKGNVRTLDKVIRREFDVVEGDPFSSSKIAKAERDIQSLDFFNNVVVRPKPGSSPDQTVIDVEVEEKSTGEVSIGAGFSSSDGALADLRIRERNFLGKGQDVLFSTTIAGERTEFDLSFTEPYFFNRDLAAGVDLFHITRDLQDESSYDQRTTGGALRLSYPLTNKLRQTLKYRYQNNEIDEVDASASRFIRDQEGKRSTSAISQNLSYIDLNSTIAPTDGVRWWLDTELAGLGGDAAFVSAKTGAQLYHPVTKKITFTTLGEVGGIEGYNDEDVQINERYFLGSRTLRGFEFGGIGPRDLATDDSLGGNYFYRGSTELSFPVGLPEEMGIKGHLFSDYGSLWDLDDNGVTIANESSLRASVGLGVSWVSPLGPIRVDFASPVLEEDFDKDETFRFDFGTRF